MTGRTVLSGRHEFLVREAGAAEDPPLVLLHGWVYDGHVTWHRVIPQLAESHRVYAIDLRSHGRSARVRGRVEIEDMADEVAGVLDALGLGTVALAGYSMGGMVAQALAHRHPGRIGRLILAGTAAQPIALPQWLVLTAFVGGRAIARLDRLIAPRIAHRYLLASGTVPPEHSAWLWEALLDRDVDLYYEAGFAILRFDAAPWVGRLAMPTLSIIPTHDQLVPAGRQRATAASLPDNRVVEIDGARHEAVLTHPGEVAGAILEFLA
jgi:pimeloyl-ACP methyl ester carboxylesterase